MATTYKPGAVKQDPESKAIAVYTNRDNWGVMTLDNGGHYASDADVESWPDLAPAPAPAK